MSDQTKQTEPQIRVRIQHSHTMDQAELTEIATLELFSGKPGALGGLSNERELARYIPKEFKVGNKWTKCVSDIFFRGASIEKWAWKSDDLAERRKQMACFRAAMMGWDSPHEVKKSLCGWMLSEMLTGVPS